MKRNKENLPPYLTIILSALALGLSRYPGAMGIFVFISLIPLFRFFDSGKKTGLQLFRAGALFSFVNILVAYHWIGLVTIPGVIGIIILFSLLLGSICLYQSNLA